MNTQLTAAIQDKLSAAHVRTIMVVGGGDVGKTTVAGEILDIVSARCGAVALDLDMGQTSIGPPTALSWGVVKGGFSGWGDIKTEGLYFTGAFSPVGNLLPAAVGARLLADEALLRCPKAVIDTTGLVTEPAGRVLKQYKIELLRPDVLVAIERDGELSGLLDLLTYRGMDIVRLRPAAGVRARNFAERGAYRQKKFREYFGSGSRQVEVDTEVTPVVFTREVITTGRESAGLVCSFRDKYGKDLALGIIEGAEGPKGKILVRTPLRKKAGYACLVAGSVRVDLDAVSSL